MIEDLDKTGIRTRRHAQSGGRIRGGIRFGVGGLAYLLQNRFFIGEVVYRGNVHPGEQEPILDRSLFEAVQAKLAAGATARQLRLKGSPAILAGRLFDDRGNRMTPTHTNKQGARYRYYVSHAIIQNRNDEAGSVSRVPAHDIETLVAKLLRERSDKGGDGEHRNSMGDRELIEQQVDRIVVKPQAIEIHLKDEQQPNEREQDDESQPQADCGPPVLTVPWSAAPSIEVKGILHSPSQVSTMSPESRDLLLTAIAKARVWIDDLVKGRVASFAEIAEQEGKVERHIRFLAPLAFVSPRIIAAIAERRVSDLKVTDLAKAVTHSWTQLSRRVSLRSGLSRTTAGKL